MTTADKPRRTFLKTVATAVGFVAAAGYVRNLVSAHTSSIQAINDNCAKDVNKQKDAWLQKQWVAMTDNEKEQMLDEILENHENQQA
ncbi:hypothetical protein [Kaarinaea lacus]